MGARRGARGHAGSTHRSVFEHDVDFDGRISPAVEDFAGDDVNDGCHFISSCCCAGTLRDPRALTRMSLQAEVGAEAPRVPSPGRTFVVGRAQMIKSTPGRKNLHGSPAQGGDIAQIFDYQNYPREKGGCRQFCWRRSCRVCGRTGRKTGQARGAQDLRRKRRGRPGSQFRDRVQESKAWECPKPCFFADGLNSRRAPFRLPPSPS